MNRLTPYLRFVCPAAVACAAAACSGSTAPTPTPPPPPPPAALVIACPTDQTMQSTTAQPIPVAYPAATSTGGTPPTQIVCTPASGAVFNVGTTPVNCTATDSKSVTDKCSFNVTLTLPPKISLTSFVAFGDSMTAGEVRSETTVAKSEGGFQLIRPLVLDPTKAYPTHLLAELRARYTGQAGAIAVDNAGLYGETAVAGAKRLPSVIDGGRYSAVLLMEGVNDFPDYRAALAGMSDMVQYASKRRGLRVYLATEPPENPSPVGCPDKLGGNWAFVAPYNDGLRSIAASQGVTLVDVNAAFNGDVTTLIDCDGLHPTPAGYQLIADTFFKSIQSTLEVAAPPTPTALRIAPARRSR